MADIDWTADPASVQQIMPLYVGMGQEGGGAKMALGPIIYCGNKLDAAKSICNVLNGKVGYKILSIHGRIVQNEDQVRDPDPGAEVVPTTFKFIAKDTSTNVEHRTSLYVPAFIAQDRAGTNAMGESLAAALNAESTAYEFRFTGTSRTR